MKSDSLLFVPSRCSHFGAPKVPESQKPELLKELHVINSSIETVPILKVTKILRRLSNSDKLNRTEEMRPRESPNRIEETRFKEFTKIMKSRDLICLRCRVSAGTSKDNVDLQRVSPKPSLKGCHRFPVRTEADSVAAFHHELSGTRLGGLYEYITQYILR